MNTWGIKVQGDDRLDDSPSRAVYKEIYGFTPLYTETLTTELQWILF